MCCFEMKLAIFDLKKILIVFNNRFFCHNMYSVHLVVHLYSQDEDGHQQPRGWLNKATALVHMHCNQDTTNLKKYLQRLSQHHSLQQPYARLEKEYKSKGSEAYKRWI